VKKVGILIDRNPLKKSCFNCGKIIYDIDRRSENSTRKSLRRLALQNGVSVGSACTATKLLHIRSYKISVVPETCGL
jgi:hypothetical protein